MPPRRRRPPRAGALSELPPLKILRSILLLQLAYYAIAFVLLAFTVLVFGQSFAVGLVLDWHTIRRDNTFGWLVAIVWLLVSFFTYVLFTCTDELCMLTSHSVVPLLLLIARSKLVPDFALTVHFINLIATSLYTRSIPTNPLWWALQLGSSALMISLGVWACRYREMRPISFPTLPTPGKQNRKASTLPNGHASGLSYEMVPQRTDEEDHS